MFARLRMMTTVFLLIAAPTLAQWDSGSDGSDGPFSPAESVEIDLGLAASLCDCDSDGEVDDPCEWSCPSPVEGQGVYDAKQWVVAFKFTSIQVPNGVTVTFKNHPSGAPVAWLSEGDVTIEGTVSLDGSAGSTTCTPIPCSAEPGPGGFGGGQRLNNGVSGSLSGGFGPGSAVNEYNSCCNCGWKGASAAHATISNNPGTTAGLLYGTAELAKLVGGSGGTATSAGSGGGGAGGGAILIAAGTDVTDAVFTLASTAYIHANGGAGAVVAVGSIAAGGGSGGAIRIRAATLNTASGGRIRAEGGIACPTNPLPGGAGRIKVEAATIIANSASYVPSPYTVHVPIDVFPAQVPTLRIVSIDSVPAPSDPLAGIQTTDLRIDNESGSLIAVEGTGMSVGTTVHVRIVPARGTVITASATLTDPDMDGVLTATVETSSRINFGLNEIQLRANW